MEQFAEENLGKTSVFVPATVPRLCHRDCHSSFVIGHLSFVCIQQAQGLRAPLLQWSLGLGVSSGRTTRRQRTKPLQKPKSDAEVFKQNPRKNQGFCLSNLCTMSALDSRRPPERSRKKPRMNADPRGWKSAFEPRLPANDNGLPTKNKHLQKIKPRVQMLEQNPRKTSIFCPTFRLDLDSRRATAAGTKPKETADGHLQKIKSGAQLREQNPRKNQHFCSYN